MESFTGREAGHWGSGEAGEREGGRVGWSRLRITFCLRYIASYFVLILVFAAAGFSNAMYMKKLFFHSLLLLFHSFLLFSCFILQQVPNKHYKDNIS